MARTKKQSTLAIVEDVAKKAIKKVDKAENAEKKAKVEKEKAENAENKAKAEKKKAENAEKKAKAEKKKADAKIEESKQKKNEALKEAEKEVKKRVSRMAKIVPSGIGKDKDLLKLKELVDWLTSVQAFDLDYISPETLRQYVAKVKIGDKCAERVGDGKLKKQWRIKKTCFTKVLQRKIQQGKCILTRGKKGLNRLRCKRG